MIEMLSFLDKEKGVVLEIKYTLILFNKDIVIIIGNDELRFFYSVLNLGHYLKDKIGYV